MSDNNEQVERTPTEPQDLEQQQRALFRELNREQTEAEQALQSDKEPSADRQAQDEDAD